MADDEFEFDDEYDYTRRIYVLGVGIIGAGRIAAAHAKSVIGLEETRLAAAADINAAAVKSFTERFPCAGHTDHLELLARDDVDYVVICLPHHLHAPIAIDAANAGKHLFIEKPLALTVEQCDDIIAAAERNQVKLHVGHHHHFTPANCKAKEIISSGELGEVVMAVDTWHKPFHMKGYERPAWFLDRACGGGMWHMNGPHMIDRLMFFLDSKVAAVKATVGSKFFDYTAHDYALAHLEFANGVHAQIVHSGYRAGVERFELEFTCLDAQLKLTGKEVLIGKDEAWSPVDFPTWDTNRRQHELFARSIQDNTDAPVNGAWSREVVRVLLACEESTALGREVRWDRS